MVLAVVAIPDDLASFLESGVSLLVGTRDAQKRPSTLRGMGARVSADRAHVTVFMPEPVAARTLANLRDNARIAVTFSRPSNYRSVQVKGRCVNVRPTTPDERAKQAIYLAAFVEDLGLVGMAREATSRLTYLPSVAAEIEVEALFEQTPGPAAGHAFTERRS